MIRPIRRSLSSLAGMVSPLDVANEQVAGRSAAPLTAPDLATDKPRYVFADAEGHLSEKYREVVAARQHARRGFAEVEAGAMMAQGILELETSRQALEAENSASRSTDAVMGHSRNRYSRYYRNQAEAVVQLGRREAGMLRRKIDQAKKRLPDKKLRQAKEILMMHPRRTTLTSLPISKSGREAAVGNFGNEFGPRHSRPS